MFVFVLITHKVQQDINGFMFILTFHHHLTNLNHKFCILIIHMAEADPYQGKFVDLDVNGLHLSVGHLTAVAFVLLVGLKVRAEPQELKGSIWIMAVIHLAQTLRTQAHIQTHTL